MRGDALCETVRIIMACLDKLMRSGACVCVYVRAARSACQAITLAHHSGA